MRIGMRVTAAAGGLLVLLAGCGDPTGRMADERAHGKDMPSAADRTWAEKTHQANLAEIAAGGMATSRGTSADVRSIGGMLVSDHTGADTMLRKSASRLRLGMPLRPDAAQRAQAAKLSAAHGSAFDKDFVRTQIAAHRTAIAQAQAEAKNGKATELRTLAQQSLPTLKKHLTMLQKAQT